MRVGETTLIGCCSMIGRRPLSVATIADPLLSSVAPIGPSKPMQASAAAIVLGIGMIFQFCRINATVSRPMSIARGTFQSPPVQEHNRRRFPGRFRAPFDSNAHIGIGQHGRVVDPVPDHRDLVALPLQTLDCLGFVTRKHFGHVLGDSEFRGDSPGDILVIAGEHHDMLDSPISQRLDHVTRLGPQRVGDGQQSDDKPVLCHAERRNRLLLHPRDLSLRPPAAGSAPEAS